MNKITLYYHTSQVWSKLGFFLDYIICNVLEKAFAPFLFSLPECIILLLTVSLYYSDKNYVYVSNVMKITKASFTEIWWTGTVYESNVTDLLFQDYVYQPLSCNYCSSRLGQYGQCKINIYQHTVLRTEDTFLSVSIYSRRLQRIPRLSCVNSK